MDTSQDKSWINPEVNRRTFLQVSGALTAATMASRVFSRSEASASAPIVTGEVLPDPLAFGLRLDAGGGGACLCAGDSPTVSVFAAHPAGQGHSRRVRQSGRGRADGHP